MAGDPRRRLRNRRNDGCWRPSWYRRSHTRTLLDHTPVRARHKLPACGPPFDRAPSQCPRVRAGSEIRHRPRAAPAPRSRGRRIAGRRSAGGMPSAPRRKRDRFGSSEAKHPKRRRLRPSANQSCGRQDRSGADGPLQTPADVSRQYPSFSITTQTAPRVRAMAAAARSRRMLRRTCGTSCSRSRRSIRGWDFHLRHCPMYSRRCAR